MTLALVLLGAAITLVAGAAGVLDRRKARTTWAGVIPVRPPGEDTTAGETTGGAAVAVQAAPPRDRPVRWFGTFELVVLAAAAAVALVLVLGPPVKGMPNQGAYQRLTVQLGIAPVPSQPYSPYSLTYLFQLHRSYHQLGVSSSVASNPKLFSYYFGYHSSELLLARVAVGLESLLSGSTTFDIRWLGFVNVVVLLLALAALVAATRQLPPRARGVAVVLLAVAFSDMGYLAYMNSFYSEPAEMGFFLLAFGLAAVTGLSRRPWLPFLGFVAAACLAASAKTEDVFASVPLILLGFVLAWRYLPSLRSRVAGSLGVVGIGAAAAWSWLSQVPYIKAYVLYDTVFDGILRASPSPAGSLAALGLDPSFARFAGYSTDAPGSGFATAVVQQKFFGHVHASTVARFYLTHPGILWHLLGTASRQSLLLRPPYGNVRLGPHQPSQLYAPNSPWTVVHRSVLPHSIWFIVVVLVAGLLVGVAGLLAGRWRPRRSRRASRPPASDGPDGGTLLQVRRTPWVLSRRTTPEVLVALAVTAALTWAQAPVGGGFDGVVKHALLFNALFDVTLIVLVAIGIDAAWTAWRTRVHAGT